MFVAGIDIADVIFEREKKFFLLICKMEPEKEIGVINDWHCKTVPNLPNEDEQTIKQSLTCKRNQK